MDRIIDHAGVIRIEGDSHRSYGLDYPVFWVDRFHPHRVKRISKAASDFGGPPVWI
ncbi:hypothetical protein [Stigmatella aurantiaca]|uniref:hypothetical protein n=1 Tax=Stigmatella aurantiaca TaxID=41 RepID=UPI0012FB271A|nr:hypothetical protein [Stigmatella aurantiaca]